MDGDDGFAGRGGEGGGGEEWQQGSHEISEIQTGSELIARIRRSSSREIRDAPSARALGPQHGYTTDGRIRLLCHESGTNRPHVVALHPDEFLRRWLIHVLPKGFVRVRHFGWMSGAARKTRLLVRALVCGQLDEPVPVLPDPPRPAMRALRRGDEAHRHHPPARTAPNMTHPKPRKTPTKDQPPAASGNVRPLTPVSTVQTSPRKPPSLGIARPAPCTDPAPAAQRPWPPPTASWATSNPGRHRKCLNFRHESNPHRSQSSR
ncbi:transposase [Haloferula sp. A504]|uniref:transposase n=1 Tax=Haloferula sp. A504 TaxID=3373601 RepID=UPI00378FDE5C